MSEGVKIVTTHLLFRVIDHGYDAILPPGSDKPLHHFLFKLFFGYLLGG